MIYWNALLAFSYLLASVKGNHFPQQHRKLFTPIAAGYCIEKSTRIKHENRYMLRAVGWWIGVISLLVILLFLEIWRKKISFKAVERPNEETEHNS